MTVKIVLSLAILAFTSGVGYLFAAKYRKRRSFCKQFCDFNDRFLREIDYTKRPIKEFAATKTYNDEFGMLLKLYLESLGEKESALNDVSSEISFLEKSEEKFIAEYFQSLGKGDSQSQKNYFSNAKNILEEWRKKAESDYKKYADLYVKLGVLIGLAIIIIII